MKYLKLLLFTCLTQFNTSVYGQTSAKEYKTLSVFFYDIMRNYDTASKFTHFFAIKAIINVRGKVDTLVFSKNTPEDLKEKLNTLKRLPVTWKNLIPLKVGEKATIIIPVIDFKQTPSEMIRLISYRDLLHDTFTFEDNKNLFNNTLIKDVWMLDAFYTQKFTEYPPEQ